MNNTASISAQDGTSLPPKGPSAKGPNLFRLSMMTLWRREMTTFFRAKSRLATALAFPVMLWLMLGFGLNNSFQITPTQPSASDITTSAADIGYLAYFFPGIIVMVLLFTAIFSTISVIDDRKSGFLQGVMVAPAPRLAIVLGKILGGATVALIQAFILTALIWPFMDAPAATILGLIPAAIAMIIVAISLTALGLAIAWPMDSTAAFHGIMNVLLMPMWFLCGALFPLTNSPIGLKILMLLNPLTYGYSVIASHLLGLESTTIPLPIAWIVMLIFAGLLVALCAKIANRQAAN